MTDVTAGQSVALLSQWYDFEGGTLTDLDTTPTISIVNIGTGTTALAATTTGVTHPAAGSYGYTWTPTAALAAGAYLATWSGLGDGTAVTATETVTVIAPASAEATNTSPAGVWYATREDVQRALDVQPSARSSRQIDRALESASRDAEGLCHRRFYPVQATRFFDWPASQYRPSWRIWLDDNELISLTAITSGGAAIDPADVLLEPNRSGPPYSRVEINIGTSATYGGGDTHQRDIAITGLWGYRNTETTLGATTTALATTTATTLTVDGDTSASVGVGSLLRIDSERLIVTGRTMAATGQTLATDLTVQKNGTTVAVADASGFAVDETLLIDGERMLITDIAGSTLVVERSVDGSTLAAHTTGATIYAARTLTVTRGALGTTAATHTTSTTVHRWEPPGLVRDLVIANAMNRLLQEQAGYARTSKTSSGAKSVSVETLSLESLRTQTYDAHGRKARHRGV
ncbi:hypothetical protein ACIQ6R_16030 [Streptomyces sp. NPDC096048]|uniref:hypothetical protein n=1 Tax=Streptomyces sp. NPDC096048 TaxID=3366072 RepID=UPI0038090036